MARTYSPLRYPGGKTCLKPIVSAIMKQNQMQRWHYVEPYAGGGGLALALLYGGHVSDIHINDWDASIWSFWKAMLDHTEDLIRLVETTEVNVENWAVMRDIQLEEDVSDPVKLGFATFFLNRTNRSGIIKGAGIIGGKAQRGNYKIDCRFNREDLVKRIRRVSKYRSRIHLTRLDAVAFMQSSPALPNHSFFCIDPPYFNKGSSLYTSFYKADDHAEVAKAVLALEHPWIVTYDNVTEIQQLYSERRQFVFDINYSVQTKRVGTELLVASKGLRLTSEIRDRQIHRVQYRTAA